MSAAEQIASEIIPDQTVFDRKRAVEEFFEIKHQIKVIEERELKGLKARLKELEAQFLANLEVGEMAAFAGAGSVSVKEEIQPKVNNWDAFYNYVTENNAFYLMPRKVNGAPFREALDAGIEVAGLEPVTIRKLTTAKRGK